MLGSYAMESDKHIVGPDDILLVTGATGFIGAKVVECLINRGFRHIRCIVRPSSDPSKVEALRACQRKDARVEVIQGNLLAREDCAAAVRDVSVIFHLAVGAGTKSYPDAFMNSVVTTRNLVEAAGMEKRLKRFVNVSSLAVYSNREKPRRRVLDESCPVETEIALREAYCFAKVRQDQLVTEYCRKLGIPYVIVRPGYVLGPGHETISNRVGIDTFGLFLHLGGSNAVPFTYVDNCAEAIILAGIQETDVNGEVFNVIDDDLPSSRQFLRLYKRNVRNFHSLYLPHFVSYALCFLWEKYSVWSKGQLIPAFNRQVWRVFWEKTFYSNEKIKTRLGWIPKVSMAEGFRRYFEGCRAAGGHHA